MRGETQKNVSLAQEMVPVVTCPIRLSRSPRGCALTSVTTQATAVMQLRLLPEERYKSTNFSSRNDQ
jgi:hypothetical protein